MRYVKERNTEEYDARFQSAVATLKTAIGEDEEDVSTYSAIIKYYLYTENEPQSPVGDTKKHLKEFIAAADKMQNKIQSMQRNRHTREAMLDLGVDLEDAIETNEQLKQSAIIILNELPKRNTDWKVHPQKELICAVADIYGRKQGVEDPRKAAREGTIKKADGQYSGPFFDLIDKLFHELDLADRGEEGLGKLIERALSDYQDTF
jgi:hypothetical protein